MTTLITVLINRFGYLAVSLLIAIENIFPPIPSEVILAFSGFITTKSELQLFYLALASTLGALIGALTLYWIGSLLKEEKISQMMERPFFKKWGLKKMMLPRLMIGSNVMAFGQLFLPGLFRSSVA